MCNGSACLFLLSLTAVGSSGGAHGQAASTLPGGAAAAGILAALPCIPTSRAWNPDEDRLVACAVTLRARYAYALRGDRAVVTFDLESCLGGEGGSCLESDELVVMDKPKYEAHAMVSHPHRNMIATAGNDGALRVFVP
jgi:hypothetical protein